MAQYMGKGTRGAGEARAPPIFYTQDFINIYTCSADRCILRLPRPRNCFLCLCNRKSHTTY